MRQGIPKGAAAQRLVLDARDPIPIVSIRYLYHCKSLLKVIRGLRHEYHLHYEYHFTGNYQLIRPLDVTAIYIVKYVRTCMRLREAFICASVFLVNHMMSYSSGEFPGSGNSPGYASVGVVLPVLFGLKSILSSSNRKKCKLK